MQKKIMVISIIMALMLTTACSVSISGDRLNLSGNVSFDEGTYMTEEQNIARNADGYDLLEVSDSAGNISIKGTSSGDINIKAIKKVKGVSDTVKKEVMDNIDIIIEENGNKLSIYPATKGGKKDDLWKWVERLYKGVQVSIDLELEVPERVKTYTVSNNAGNISFSDMAGEISVNNNAGNIELNGVKLAGSNNIKLNSGNINIDTNISQASKLTIVNTAGNVTLKLPENSSFDLDAKLTAGNISGDFIPGTRINSGSFKQKINGGGTAVRVTTVAGNVTINNK